MTSKVNQDHQKRNTIFSSRYTIRIKKVSPTSAGQKKSNRVSFSVSGAGLFFISVLSATILIGFFVSTTLYTIVAGKVEDNKRELRLTQGELDALLESSDRASRAAEEFEDMFSQVAELAGIQSQSANTASSQDPIIPVAINLSEEVYLNKDISRVISTLNNSLTPLSELRDLLYTQGALLADIPNLWPIANNHGHVTMEFGPNRHPTSNQWYLHKGIDIAGTYGVGVMASANGKVIEAGYNSTGYGHYVLLRHKYGFRTRYSHLSRIYVTESQEVSQGEVIGAIGNSGISTGPHLDFQVILGTDVVDPSLFLKISRRGFARWSGNR